MRGHAAGAEESLRKHYTRESNASQAFAHLQEFFRSSLAPKRAPSPSRAAFGVTGVSEGEIMKLCGCKTRDMFDRYNIIDQADLSRAVRAAI